MRIAFFSDNLYPELSGIADTIVITGRELTKRGHTVCYVGPRYSKPDYDKNKQRFPSAEEQENIDGMPVVRLRSVRLPLSPTGQSRFAFPTGASFAFLKEFKPDIIHTQSAYGVGFEAKRAAKKFGVPLIGTNHTAIEDFFPFGTRAFMRYWDAHYYNHCDFVTAPYQALIERMREVGFKKPGTAVANPVELATFMPPSAEEKALLKQEFKLDGPVVLYVGRLGIEKCVDVVVRGFAELKKKFPTATLIATGHGAAEPYLRELADGLGVANSMRFVGFLERDVLAKTYKAADVFAFMSTSDSQSISLMQAYATGMPAVCARARGLPDYTPPEAGFLVEPGDHMALADKLTKLLREDTLRHDMGTAAQAFVQRFTPEKIAQKWEEIYRSAIENKK
ncbi:MAG: hypothetical protein JWO43_63 [Candidatus Adlerbacteria bacterium]|nr:hypothetical protein [Candidatus Adlerbacteria bacterium]